MGFLDSESHWCPGHGPCLAEEAWEDVLGRAVVSCGFHAFLQAPPDGLGQTHTIILQIRFAPLPWVQGKNWEPRCHCFKIKATYML